jgi:PAS fold
MHWRDCSWGGLSIAREQNFSDAMSKYLTRPQAILACDNQTKPSVHFLLRRHAYRMLGASCDRFDVHANLQQVTAKIHPNDVGKFTTAFHEAVQGLHQGSFDCTYRVIAKDGSIRILHSHAASSTNLDGDEWCVYVPL